MRALAIAAVLALAGCTPTQAPFGVSGWDFPLAAVSAPRGGLVVSIAFDAKGGEENTPMPRMIGAVRVVLTGPEIQPLESWWRNSASQPITPWLRIENLEPGRYHVALTLYDGRGGEFGTGSGNVKVVAHQTQQVRLAMTYQLGKAAATVTVSDSLPTGE